ncbi:MAG: glycosyltransferase family 2 protein [Gemmatimonadaceae bacterium]
MSTPRVSVVIPTHQRRASLLRTLAALSSQTLSPGEYEVVVIVDGSDDGSREAAESLISPHERRVLWQDNRGRAAACNAGVAAARAPLIVLLDDDMRPAPGFLSAHLRAHPAGSRLAVLGAAPVEVTPDLRLPASYVGKKFNRHLERLASTGGPLRLRDFYSGNFSIRRDVLNAVGGFDERFTLYGNEDLELSIRLRDAGVRLVFEPSAVAVQTYEKDFAALARDNISKGRTAVILARKHPGALEQLKIGGQRGQPIGRRMAVQLLLASTRVVPSLRQLVVRVVTWLGERNAAWVQRLYPAVLDYFYHCGARDERGTPQRQPRA